MPARDDETETVDTAELVATFYHTLLRRDVPPAAAQRLTVAWILGKLRRDAPGPLDIPGLEDDRG